ncbi:hypothetical protein F4818DRAFT_455103 [Hypoxylon cercidicola]|nr:hypothetical protein F4818DRAFT_455103 [Hypoxylon cercidicola]
MPALLSMLINRPSSMTLTRTTTTSVLRMSMPFTPIAICGMACRLPGGVQSPQELWDFLLSKGDARTIVPKTRYNVSAFYSPTKKPGHTVSEHGYFLDENVDLGALDTSVFPMPSSELESLDPQQRILLEVAKESLDDAGEIEWKGKDIGVFVGTFGNDWYDILQKESQRYGTYFISTSHDFALSNRVSYEMDLHGPSMTIRTACSSSLVALNEACAAIAKGDCPSAIVGGTNIILDPSLTTDISNLGVLSPEGSCKTFSSSADGYARGEGIVTIYIKSLSDALREGNPIQAVILGSATNCDGKTSGFTVPNPAAQEALIRHTYKVAGISEADISKTGYMECHGTGTPRGDSIEISAVTNVFGNAGGIHIGSIKPNIGHGEGASGLSAVIKAVMALKHRAIPPNIKCFPLSEQIPLVSGQITVPTETTPWPKGRYERVSINSFGVGGANAHVILESPKRFDHSNRGIPQLLVYSASSMQSVKSMTQQYSAYLEAAADDLDLGDVAFTLARRREHLRYRSFTVRTMHQPGFTLSPAAKGEHPCVVMVFTGQGAQWPRMGRQLLLTNSVFRESIRSLDGYLQDLGPDAPDWRIEDELLKTSQASRVHQAEFAQPLCTALQIAIVAIYSSAGVTPWAVTGHSSGEIAAAYAAGSLTAREAILVAFYRGLVSKKQTRLGAMASVGLGWEEVKEFLVPDVVVACDNSPNSVTISGDADKLTLVFSAIKQAHPTIYGSILKVEKAYHSSHMSEIGEEYYRSMTNSGIFGKIPSIPFFSSVSGGLLSADEKSTCDSSILGPRYWQKNLESRVLFRDAISSLLSHPLPSPNGNIIMLEVGPHGSLAGPIRQTLASYPRTVATKLPHIIPTMTRHQNSVEGFLTAVGNLWTLGVNIDFASLMNHGRCLASLPQYPWHHPRSYWSESRTAREWRLRENPYHDLLGARVPESSAIEPMWRNLFHIENTPWVRDHMIRDDIIFPFAGYVAIAAEAAGQMMGFQEAVELRHVFVTTALVLKEGTPTELVTTLRHSRLTDHLDSQWWEFTITAYNGHTWTKHCCGEVRSSTTISWQSDDIQAKETNTPHKVNVHQWYERVRRGGLRYGDSFKVLENVRTSTGGSSSLGLANMRTNRSKDEGKRQYLHPVILDSVFQLMGAAAHHVAYIALSHCSSDNLTLSSGCAATPDCTPCLNISGARFSPLDSEEDDMGCGNITARQQWVAHADFIRPGDLVKPLLGQLAITLSPHSTPHLQSYTAWLSGQSFPELEALDDDSLTTRIGSLHVSLSEGPSAPAANAIYKLAINASHMMLGKVGASEILNADGLLDQLHRFLGKFDASNLLYCLTHRSGLGPVIASVLEDIRRSKGQDAWSLYVYTEKLPGLLTQAQNRFAELPKSEFAVLDISRDLLDQGFEGRQFDLIIASGTIHTTSSVIQSLKRVHDLLSTDGRLVLQQPREGLRWIKYLLGALPGWWCGIQDGREDQPYLSLDKWEEALNISGFSGLDGAVLDSPEPLHLSTVMMARSQQLTNASNKQVTVLCDISNCSPTVTGLKDTLEARGFQVSCCAIESELPVDNDIISLLDEANPYFESITEASFEELKQLVYRLSSLKAGILWVTRSTQTHCPDPRYAPVLGFARTVRLEMGVDFATCEIDDFQSPNGLQAIVEVFLRFHGRSPNTRTEFEYSIAGDVTRVCRFSPHSLYEEARKPDASSGEVALVAGRLGSLQWTPKRSVTDLEGNQLEIDVYCVGFNFRDILEVRGVLPPVDDREQGIGQEASGIVRRIGPGVSKVAVGDRVMALGIGAFSTTLITTELLCEVLPDSISFEDGASMPVVFQTAIYSLVNVGRLEKGQSVLIHSGCGGVGLACIQIARMLGAEIYTTVGNGKKADFLVKTLGVPRNRIFNSRATTFADDILRETAGKGVDLAVNSLSGDLLHATWHCIAKWGTMVEIGKIDLLGSARLDMSMFLGSRNYCCFDLRQMTEERPQIVSRLLRSIVTYYREGLIQPIPLDHVYQPRQVHDAFRYMQRGIHTGKVVMSLRSDTGESIIGDVAAPLTHRPSLDASATYLLVGGFGGLGRTIAVWMVQHGARNLVFLSRREESSSMVHSFVHMLASMGCTAQFVRGSVTNIADIIRAVDGATSKIKGIIHMAMVLKDQTLPHMTIDDWNCVVRPKITGTWNLHEVSRARSLDLDFFLLFSSLSGVLGQPGQANYAAANAFLDAFAKYRVGMGLPCAAIDIGAMEGVGYLLDEETLLRKMRGMGWQPVREEQLLEAVSATMSSGRGRHGKPLGDPLSPIVDENSLLVGLPSVSSALGPATDGSTRFSQDVRMAAYLNQASLGKVSNTSTTLNDWLVSAKNEPAIFESPEAAVIVAGEIGTKLFALLLKTDDKPNIDLSLAELGLDSLIAVELRGWCKQVFGVDISVLEMLGMGTLKALGKRMVDHLGSMHGG